MQQTTSLFLSSSNLHFAMWREYSEDASDPLDVQHATHKVTAGMFAATQALNMPMQPLPVSLGKDRQAAPRHHKQ